MAMTPGVVSLCAAAAADVAELGVPGDSEGGDDRDNKPHLITSG
jgi:hypothetical protein